MNRVASFLVFFIVSVTLCPAPALAEDAGQGYGVSLGAGVGVSTSEYRGEDTKVSPVPILKYEGEHFFVRGLSAGAHLYRDEVNDLSVNVSYLSQSFDADESDDSMMKLLDDRDSTMMAGFSYGLRGGWGAAGLSLSADVLDTNNGLVGDASYACPFKLSFLKIKPVVGVEWTSENYNDYYYGVDSSESVRSGMGEYGAGSGFSPYLGLGLKCDLTHDFEMMLKTRVRKLSREISDSPMVDRDVTYSLVFGLGYSF
jgi:outer membrane protein